MKKNRVCLGLIMFCLPCWCHAGLVLGIDRSHLMGQPIELQSKALKNIRSLHAKWFRDGSTSGKDSATSAFVNEMKLANDNGLSFLVNLVQLDEDYDGPLQKNTCGWNGKKLSKINLSKYKERLVKLFSQIRAAGLSVDAAEFGNEDDQYCYDADVPQGHADHPSKEELGVWLKGYGEFLKAGVSVLHDTKFFPKAKVITFGMAHAGDPANSFATPAEYVAMLKQVDGFNYLENKQYSVDGYGTHYYPSPNRIEMIEALVREDLAQLGRDKRLWVTEWGFLNANAFPNQSGKTLSECLGDLISRFSKLSQGVSFGPLLFYRYDEWLSDANGELLPVSQVFANGAWMQ